MTEPRKPVTTARLKRMKQDGEPIAMITAYDYPSAYLAEEAGADMILVGDSLGNVVLGYDSTLPVTLNDIVYHTRAVSRAVRNAYVVSDMPFNTYHGSVDTTLRNAGRIMQEGLAKGVKLEGGTEITGSVKACVNAGIPVVGHLGLTPQSIHQIGGFIVQGKKSAQAQKLIDSAKALEDAGAFAVVLELMTEQLSALITEEITIPTIGIGASSRCDGQVLVFHDMLQYGPSFPKKFVKSYANLNEQISSGIRQYVQDVKSRNFPSREHIFQGDEDLLDYLYGASSKE